MVSFRVFMGCPIDACTLRKRCSMLIREIQEKRWMLALDWIKLTGREVVLLKERVPLSSLLRQRIQLLPTLRTH